MRAEFVGNEDGLVRLFADTYDVVRMMPEIIQDLRGCDFTRDRPFWVSAAPGQRTIAGNVAIDGAPAWWLTLNAETRQRNQGSRT